MFFLVLILLLGLLFFLGYKLSYTLLTDYDGLGKQSGIAENPYGKGSFDSDGNWTIYNDENYYSAVGVDVSVYQGDINWKKAKKDGVQFAMIRLGYRSASDGKLHRDKKFRANIKGAADAGVLTGVYFFSQARTVKESIREAEYVLKNLKGRNLDLPVAFDMEPVEGGDRISDLSVMEKTEITDAFCSVIEENGYHAMVYGNPDWLQNEIDLSYLTRYPVWLAHYADETSYPGDYTMWQYSDRGDVDGFKGAVDLDICFLKKEKE